MTTIAFDEFSVASDSGAFIGESYAGTAPKIILDGGVIYAFAGELAYFKPMVSWYKGGANPEKYPRVSDTQFIFLVISRTGVDEYSENNPYPTVMSMSKYAYGSGSGFANGALKFGASAKEAIEVSKFYDSHTCGDVDVIRYPWLLENASDVKEAV